MKTAKHTPGPWKRASYRLYTSQMASPEYPIHAAKRGLIAKAYRKCDADLIATLPDLCAERDKLKALNAELVEQVEIFLACNPNDFEERSKARTLLSKANEQNA